MSLLELPKAELPPEIKTTEQAVNWAESLIRDVEDARVKCDFVVPKSGEAPAKQQLKNFHAYLLKHGSALGAIGALMRVGLLAPEAYNDMTARVRATLVPTQVGRRE